MSTDAIYDDFCDKLSAFAGSMSPALPVAFPGVGFNPPSTGYWLELNWIPNQTVNYGLAADAPVLLQGMAQVNVCWRPGPGILGGMALAGQVIAAFPKGTVIGNTVRIYRKGWVGGDIPDPERVMLPVTLMWRGFAA